MDKVQQKYLFGLEEYSNTELTSLALGISEEIAAKIDYADYGKNILLKGVGEKTILQIGAIKELARRLYAKRAQSINSVHSPEDGAHFALPIMGPYPIEHFAVMLLNTKNHIIGFRAISRGSLSSSIVHPREVFREAVIGRAASIILFHNHPSGDPSPSREDIAVTERLVKAGNIMGIPVLDHIIIGASVFMSFKEEGLFPNV